MAGATWYTEEDVVAMNPDLFQGVEIVDVFDDRKGHRYVVSTVDGGRHIIAKEALQHLPTEDVLAITRFQTRSRSTLTSGERRPWPDKQAAALASLEDMKAGLHQLRDAERGVRARMDEFALRAKALPKEMTVHPYEGTDKYGLFCPCGHGGIFTEQEAHFGVQRVCVKCDLRVVPNKPSDPHEGTLPAYGEVRKPDEPPTWTFHAGDLKFDVPDEPDYTFDTYKQELPAWRK